MDPVVTPRFNLNFSVDLDIEYNPFKGKTEEEFFKYVENELHEVMYDISPSVKNVYTSLVTVEKSDEPRKP